MSALDSLKKIVGKLLNSEITLEDKEIILKELAGLDSQLSKIAKTFTMIDLGSWLEKHIRETLASLSAEQIQRFNRFGNAAIGASLIHYMRLKKAAEHTWMPGLLRKF